jgi:probable selenium-dependent hydroxylase accessory protein YqeC
VAAITGREIGDKIRPADVAIVIASPVGGLKGIPSDATVVPVVNEVDEEADAAREVAEGVLDRADIPRVLLTRLIADDLVVELIS